MAASLATPFVAELVSQLGRKSFVLSSFDSPSRGLLCISIFIFLTFVNPRKLLNVLSWGSFFGIFLVFLSIILFPEYYWGPRAATYFVDPITLPCYTAMMLGLVLFSHLSASLRWDLALKTIAAIASFYIAIESGSRSAWAALMVLAVVLVFHVSGKSLARLVVGLICIIFVFVGLYFFSDVAQERSRILFEALYYLIKVTLPGFNDYNELERILTETSTGHRFLIFLVDFELIKQAPFFGVADSDLPPFEILGSEIEFLSPQVYEIKKLSGSHSEFSALFVRRGLVFGALSLWALFGYPLYLAIKLARSSSNESRALGWIMIGAITPIAVTALGIQVFNLKMTISFYSLCCSIFMALALKLKVK